MLETVGFFDRAAAPSRHVGADQWKYEITVIDGERRHHLVFESEGRDTAPLRDLAEDVIQNG
jgi:hypothetical protein